MKRRTRIATLMVAALTTTSLAVVGQAQAKTYKITKFVLLCKLAPGATETDPATFACTHSGPFGKGKATANFVPGKPMVLTIKGKGGTATMTINGKLEGTTTVGPWKIKKGTGKFRGIKGKGTTKGVPTGANFDVFKFTFKGTAKS